MSDRNPPRYTLQGQVRLGEAIRHWRSQPKPDWKPHVTTGLTAADIRKEKNEPWDIELLVDILNREFQPNPLISFSAIQTLERPSSSRKAPPDQLLIYLASLGFIKNPKTGKPYTDQDLRAIAQERLDWQTGEAIAFQESQG